jgi:uncharacterized protein (TIGR00255 family)
MINSMTGYGKAECLIPQGKIVIEIKTLNGKGSDVNIKTQLIPRDKELEARQYISKELVRGTIDLYANYDQNGTDNIKSINKELFNLYYNDIIKNINASSKEKIITPLNYEDKINIATTVVKMPDVLETKRAEIDDQEWTTLFGAIKEAVSALKIYREKEGEILYNDVTKRVTLIESYVSEVEKYEKERTDSVKERLRSRIEELNIQPDANRLEQEIIFYLEKLDINEEKVRLRQHCKYFIETINKEPNPGKKLGFIAQEMGREINTMGSKANHAQIQQWVVKMKDELEKIKEQSLNIL